MKSFRLATLLLVGLGCLARPGVAQSVPPKLEPIAAGPFEPTWPSLSQYQIPEWFADAKFGIWAHWGPQCQPEMSDWYAKFLYQPVNTRTWAKQIYPYHVVRYGHPSKFGFKDVIRTWQAERWDPAALIALYKRAGAQYFMALANHHDNFDLWDSQYQPWNATRIGPKKNLIAGWAAATRAAGLRFGVSVHSSHAWSWYEPAQGSDPTGPLAGVPYDGKLTLADGKGTWWEGLDPQDLYAQNHPVSDLSWKWELKDPTAKPDDPRFPSRAYLDKFYNRTVDLINKYDPDIIYFDDDVVPFEKISDVGLRIAAHYYNQSMARHQGRVEAVMTGNHLSEEQKRALAYNIERGRAEGIQARPWQTATCIGIWHYDRSIYEKGTYRQAPEIIQLLVDVISKNGNLILSVPLRGEGTVDDLEVAVLQDIASWMDVNREAVFATRPWKVYGEGPSTVAPQEKGSFGGLKDGGKFTAADVRYTVTKDGRTLYAFLLGWPEGAEVTLGALGTASQFFAGQVGAVQILGVGAPSSLRRDAQGLHVAFPVMPPPKWARTAVVMRISLLP